MLKELIGYFNSIKKTQAEIKVTLSETKKNLQGINSGVDEAKKQINDLEYKKEKNSIRTTRKESKQRGQNKEPLGHLQMYQHSNHRGARRDQKEQEIENLFEKIVKENVPSLAKELYMQVQDAQRVPKKLDPRRNISRHITIKLPKVKDKERIL